MDISMKFIEAMAFAADAHSGQTINGTSIPYISRPIAISALVMEFGGDEDQVIAALLNNVIEKCDPVYAEKIQEIFGARVWSTVYQLAETPASDGTTWIDHKTAYINRIKDASPQVLLVKACEALHDIYALTADATINGSSAFIGEDGLLRYYKELTSVCRYTAAGNQLLTAFTNLETIISVTKAIGVQ